MEFGIFSSRPEFRTGQWTSARETFMLSRSSTFMGRNNKLVAINRWKNARRRDEERIKASGNLLEDKAALCGFLSGDGSIVDHVHKGRHRCSISFYPDDVVMRDTYLDILRRLYGKELKVRAKSKFYIMRFSDDLIVQDIKGLSPFGIKRWQPPAFVLASTELQRAWLRAFFSAEGYVGKDSVRVQTVNKAGMEAVSGMLDNVGIEHHCYVYHPKKENHSSVHIITILSFNARQKYAQLIGFWHARKTEKLALVLKKTTKSVRLQAAIA